MCINLYLNFIFCLTDNSFCVLMNLTLIIYIFCCNQIKLFFIHRFVTSLLYTFHCYSLFLSFEINNNNIKPFYDNSIIKWL